MEEDYISKILESLGWPQDETFIPVANDENLKLLDAINNLSKLKSEKSKNVESREDRVKTLKSHYDNTNQEIEQNLKLIYAHRNQQDTEHHFLKLSEQQENRFTQQISEIKNSNKDFEKYQTKTQNEVEKIQENLSSLAEKIQWAKSAINEFRLAMENGAVTKQLIERYCRLDVGKAELLESKRKILQTKINKQREHLVNAYEDQKSLEQVLDRTAQLYRQAHVERRGLVSTWKDAVNQMNQREKDIEQAEIELENAKDLSTSKTNFLHEQIEFLEQQIQNNRDSEYAIEELNVHCSKLRNRLTSLTENISLKKNELATIKKTVHNVSLQLQNQRQKNRQTMQENESKQAIYNKDKELYGILLMKEQNFKNRNLSAQERLKQIDEMMESEERTIKALQTEISRLSGALYRSQQQLKTLQDEEKTLTMDYEALGSLITALNSKYKIQDRELLRQIEILYGIDFNVQQLERRISNMQGTGGAKNQDLERKIVYLEQQLKRKKQDQNLLQTQVSKIEEDMKKMILTFNQDNTEYEKLVSLFKERQMQVEGGEKEIIRQTLINQEKLVEQSILKMKANQLEKEIQRQNDKSFNLEQHKLSLDIAMKERLIDIKTQKDLITLEKRNLGDELSTLRADIAERNVKIDVLKKRFDCAMELLGRNEDGSIVTATQIKIQNAQERHLLLKEGNDLNEKVLQAEEDIKAMENTLRLMNYSNENYRRKFETVEEENPLATELASVQEQYCKATQKFKAHKATLSAKTNQTKELNLRREELDKIIEEISHSRLDNNDVLVKIHKELLEQKVKMQRAERELKKSVKVCKTKLNDPDYITLFEKDLNVKELEERNSSALQQMADLIENNFEIGPALSKCMYEKGLSVPQFARSKSQASVKSIASGGSEYSIQVVSASSKASDKSSDSRASSKMSIKSGMTPSIVMIGFPGNCTMRTSASSKSNLSK